MKKKSLLVVLVFAAFVAGAFFLKSQPDNVPVAVTQHREKKVDKQPESVVQVFAEETKKFIADDFVVRLSLDLRQESKEALMKKMAERRLNLFAVMEKLNIPEVNVEQTSADLNKLWNYGSGRNTLRGYRATQTFLVRVESRAAVNDLERALLQVPDVEMRGMTAGLKNPDSLQKGIVIAACEKAYAKAVEYARSVNENVTSVLNIDGDVHVEDFSDKDSVEITASMNLRMELSPRKNHKKPLITVNADETKKFAADEYEANLKLKLTGKNADQLYNLVAARRTSMLALINEMEIPESAVEQSSVKLEKVWNYKGGSETLVGYRASQNFVVKVNSKMKVATLVDVLSSAEDVEIANVHAKLTKMDSLQSVVLKQTSAKAMNKARDFAEGFHGKVGKVMYVGDGANSSNVGEFDIFDQVRMNRGMMKGVVMGKSVPDLSAIADSVAVSSNVQLTVEIK